MIALAMSASGSLIGGVIKRGLCGKQNHAFNATLLFFEPGRFSRPCRSARTSPRLRKLNAKPVMHLGGWDGFEPIWGFSCQVVVFGWFLALNPISVAVDRSNSTESCLVLTLLLAAGALSRAF